MEIFYRSLLVFFLFSCLSSSSTDAVASHGNITIKWDIMSWTPDGYVATVSIYNYQRNRGITAPGWALGWAWAKKEVIWAVFGARPTRGGDCSRYKRTSIPRSCKKNPTVVDLSPGVPYNQHVADCCKGGVLAPWGRGRGKDTSSFLITVGATGNTNSTVAMPKNFTLKGRGPGYDCGPAKSVRHTLFVTADGRRVTRAFATWNITCICSG